MIDWNLQRWSYDDRWLCIQFDPSKGERCAHLALCRIEEGLVVRGCKEILSTHCRKVGAYMEFTVIYK